MDLTQLKSPHKPFILSIKHRNNAPENLFNGLSASFKTWKIFQEIDSFPVNYKHGLQEAKRLTSAMNVRL